MAETRSWFERLDSAPVLATAVIAYVPLLFAALIQVCTFCDCGKRLAHFVVLKVRACVQKLLVYLLPHLFGEKKVEIESDTMCNVLHFMDHPLDGEEAHSRCNSVTFWVFGTLVVSVLCMTVFAFFRYFPIEKSNECQEFDSNFRTLYCFTNASELPVNCTDIDQATEVICYAYRLDLPLAIGASYGLMQFASLLVTVGVYAAKIWMEFYSTKVAPRCRKSVWQCCSSVKCGTMWLIVLFVSCLIVTGVLVAVVLFTKPVQKVPETLNEVSYDMAYEVRASQLAQA